MFYKRRIEKLKVKIVKQKALIYRLEFEDALSDHLYYAEQLTKAYPVLDEMEENLKILEGKYENAFFKM